MAFAAIPTGDPAMARRLRRQLMGIASYLMFLLPMAYAQFHGWMKFDWRGLALFLAVAVAVNLFFFALIRSGRTAHLRDPSLTSLQIAISMLLALVVIHYADEGRPMLLMLFVASLFFGVFGISRREFLVLAIGAVAGYALLVLWETRGLPWDAPRVRMEGLQLLTLAMILVWLSLLGSYVGGLRSRLAHRNVELGGAMARLRALVSHDELTGVYNRRHLIDVLDREKERSDRYSHPFSICLIDLDHFKQVNDTLGHAAGDDVLRGYAERMLVSSRRIDWVGRGEPKEGEDISPNAFGRYGGEEFLLVLPNTATTGAIRCVERLRERTQAAPFDTVAGPVPVTFSAGVAEYRPGERVADTLARADGALYRAKAGGRNRTEAAP